MGAKRSRDERKERAAEERRAKEARDRRQRRIVYGIAAPVALVIIALVPIDHWYQAHQRGKQHAVGYMRSPTAAAKAAGCTGVRNDRQIPTSIVKAGTTVDYAKLAASAGQALPPTSGPREANPLPDTPAFYARTAAPRPERAVGNLNHGYVVAWYDSQLPAADVKTLQNATAQNARTLVVPWTRSVFPSGQHLVFAAWDRTQRCMRASAAALTEFASSYRDADASGQSWASPSAPTPNGSGGSAPTAKPSASAPPTTAPTTLPTTAPTTQPTTSATLPPASASPTPAPFPKVTVSPVR